jgi:hypothetical protein
MVLVLVFNQRVLRKAFQQSVHLTLGILRKSQAFFYALSFFQLDGFAVPAPAQVTQTVGLLKSSHYKSHVKENSSSLSI